MNFLILIYYNKIYYDTKYDSESTKIENILFCEKGAVLQEQIHLVWNSEK